MPARAGNLAREQHSRWARARPHLLVRLAILAGCAALAWTIHHADLWGAVTIALAMAGAMLAGAMLLRRWTVALLERRRLHGSSLGDIDAMTGDAFEDWVARSLTRGGFQCMNLPRSHDYGIDLIATAGGRRVGVQAKRYDGPVGNAAVQQAIAGAGHHACAVAAVVTQSRFTSAARAQAAKAALPVVLIDRRALPELAGRLRRAR